VVLLVEPLHLPAILLNAREDSEEEREEVASASPVVTESPSSPESFKPLLSTIFIESKNQNLKIIPACVFSFV